MFFLDARNHALFSLTQRVTCHAYMTYIAADKVARVCTTNVTKTVNIVPSKESYFYSECQGLAYLHIAEFTSWICLDSKCEVINVVCFWGFMSSFNLSSGYSLQLQVNLKMLHVWHLPSLRKQLTFHYASSCATIPRSEKCFWLDEANFQPIRGSMRIWVVHVNSMEFLRSFLRCHFMGKPQVA